MFEKDLSLSLLYDLYAPILSRKKRDAFEAYYLSDLSLAEIAEETGTSRQAVRDLVSRACRELQEMEKEMGILRKRKEISDLCDRLLDSLTPEQREIVLQIREIL